MTLPPPKRKRLLGLAGAILILLAGTAAAIAVAVHAYLRSDSFRQFIAQKTGRTLNADVQIRPLQFTGMNVYTESVSAEGSDRAPFSSLQAEQVRLTVSTKRFFEHVWQLDDVQIQKVQWTLDGPRSAGAPALEQPATTSEGNAGIFPNRTEASNVNVRNFDLNWTGGRMAGVSVTAKPVDGGWSIEGRDGRVDSANLPTCAVEEIRVRYAPPMVFVQSADLRQGANGEIGVTGEVQLKEGYDLHANLKSIALEGFLSPDWRQKLSGSLSGEIRAQGALGGSDGNSGGPALSGELFITDARLEALPILDQMAHFTRSAKFRRLVINKAGGKFTKKDADLQVTDFAAESNGLIRVEGAFSIRNDVINGAFQVGLTPSSLQWLPGSQERVFTVSRGGYLWTPVRLTGPAAKPQEDLSPRLAAAAKGAAVDAAVGTLEDVVGKPGGASKKELEGAANKAIDFLFGK